MVLTCWRSDGCQAVPHILLIPVWSHVAFVLRHCCLRLLLLTDAFADQAHERERLHNAEETLVGWRWCGWCWDYLTCVTTEDGLVITVVVAKASIIKVLYSFVVIGCLHTRALLSLFCFITLKRGHYLLMYSLILCCLWRRIHVLSILYFIILPYTIPTVVIDYTVTEHILLHTLWLLLIVLLLLMLLLWLFVDIITTYHVTLLHLC